MDSRLVHSDSVKIFVASILVITAGMMLMMMTMDFLFVTQTQTSSKLKKCQLTTQN